MSQVQNPYTQQNPNAMPERTMPQPPSSISYICGDCGASTNVKTNEQIRCKECGHRVLYKPRTHRIVGFVSPSATAINFKEACADHLGPIRGEIN